MLQVNRLIFWYTHVQNLQTASDYYNCSNNYGPNQHPEKLIPKLIFNIINNINLPIYGNEKILGNGFLSKSIAMHYTKYSKKVSLENFTI